MQSLWPLTALFASRIATPPTPTLDPYTDAEIDAVFAALPCAPLIPELAPPTSTDADLDAAFAALTAPRHR